MRSDGPTLPRLGGYALSAVSDPDPNPEISHETPTWPPIGEGPGGAHGADRFPDGRVRASLLQVSLGANAVLLIGLLTLLLLKQTGVIAGAGASGSTGP